jgi:hypothetical protein
MYRFLKISMICILSCLVFACEEKYERIVPPVDISGTLTQDVPAEGGTYYLTVTYEGEVTLKSTESWCTAEYLAGTTTNNIKITVAPNNTGTEEEPYPKKRSARVSILTFSNPTTNVQMNQEGVAAPVPDKPKVMGNWQFKNPANFGKAATGADLELKGNSFFEAEGINGSTAVEVAKGSYFLAKHGIEANGGGTKVNNYSIMFDFKYPNDNRYCFYQTNLANNDDVDFFQRNNMKELGIGSVYTNLPNPITSGVWHRVVVSAQLGTSLKYYLDGVEIFSDDGTAEAARIDSRLALDPNGVLLFADEDGEDENIYIAQVTIWDQPLSADDVTALGDAGSNDYLTFEGPLTGMWLFENPEYLGVAEVGNELIQVGNAIWEAEGPSENDKAVSVGKGSYFLAKHGIAASGGGTKANNYSIMIDFKLPNDNCYCFYQTNLDNNDDVDFFLRSNMYELGIGGVYSNLSADPIKSGVWYRLVVSAQLGESLKYYLNGKEIFSNNGDGTGALDSRLALDPNGVLFFADEDGEDNEIYIAATAIWNKALSKEEVEALGQVGDPIQ